MNEDHLRLIQEEIDGLNSASESARVADLISESSELREFYNGLRLAKASIGSLTEIEPPVTLRASIMNALPDQSVERPVISIKSMWANLVASFAQPKPAALAYAFSVGLITAFVISTVFVSPWSGADSSQIVGSIGALGADDFESTTEHIIEGANSAQLGTVNVHQKAEVVAIEFSWTTDRPAAMQIQFDEELLSVAGTMVDGENAQPRISAEPGGMAFSGDGPLEFYVTLQVQKAAQGDHNMSFSVHSDDQSLLSRSFEIGKY